MMTRTNSKLGARFARVIADSMKSFKLALDWLYNDADDTVYNKLKIFTCTFIL